MTMRRFIREHRSEIDALINAKVYEHDGQGGRGVIPDPPPTYDDEERRLWILNDEQLYLWAKREGANP